MDSIEENGNSNNVDDSTPHNNMAAAHATTQQQQQNLTTANTTTNNASSATATPVASATSVLTSTANVVQYLPPHGLQVQSVIQAANQSSVIQTAAPNTQAVPMPKGNVLFVKQPNTVIHTTSGNAVQIKPEPNTQHPDTNSDDSYTDDDSPRQRRELTRRPSYHKIYNEISGPDMSAGTTLQIPESAGLPPTIAGGSTTTGLTVHLPQDGASGFYIPNRIPYNASKETNQDNSVIAEDQTRKREIRLQKNREAARECRRKKKEYIKCLENRVAVLENQNKALIEELKSLKELYCQTKND